MAEKRNLNEHEKKLVFDLYNLGMTQDHIAEFFDIAQKTVYKYYLAARKRFGDPEYSLAEKSKIMTEYLLSSLVRSMHSMTTEAKLKFLPDLLKIKDDAPDETEVPATMYIPVKETKTEYYRPDQENQIPSELSEHSPDPEESDQASQTESE